MHTPTKKQWQKVIDTLMSVLPLAIDYTHTTEDSHLNMWAGNVNDRHLFSCNRYHCGTVHCVAGWYIIGVLQEELFGEEPGRVVCFDEGMYHMASDLGFSNAYKLRRWAYKNPQIWGNTDGVYMFTSERAYDDASNLEEVIAFLSKVQERSPN